MEILKCSQLFTNIKQHISQLFIVFSMEINVIILLCTVFSISFRRISKFIIKALINQTSSPVVSNTYFLSKCDIMYIFPIAINLSYFALIVRLCFEKDHLNSEYRNDPKFSDRLVWANSADPDQTAPRGSV